jgi:hypothetical protein
VFNIEGYKDAKGTFSQFQEDIVLLELVRRVNPPRFYVEIGAGDGTENCTRILKEDGWQGLWFDPLLGTGKVQPWQVHQRLTAAGCPFPFGVLSIDVDGNDYWLWEGFGKTWYRPAIVVIEAQIQRPFDVPYIMPFDAEYEWDHKSHDCGASVCSLVELGKKMGYTFVGKCPDYHSPNLFFVSDEHAQCLEDA